MHCVYSDCWAIDRHGCKLWPMDLSRQGVGAVEAYSRACFTEFPPLDPNLVQEEYDDVVYSERARILCRERIHVPERLVYYRQGSGVSSFGTPYTKMLINSAKARIACAKQLLQDVAATSVKAKCVCVTDLQQIYEMWIDNYTIQYDLCASTRFSKRIFAWRKAHARHIMPVIISLIMLAPPTLRNTPIDVAFSVYRYVKQYFRK